MFWLAWILFAVSLVLPAPRSFYPDHSSVVTGMFVIGMAGVWARKYPGGFDGIHFAGLLVFVLSLFSNVVFFFTILARKIPRLSIAWRVLLIASVAIDGSLVFFFPFFARLPAYWLWLAAFLAVTWGLVFLEAPQPARTSKTKRFSTESDDVPALLWVWIGFAFFWLGVTTVNYAQFRNRLQPAPIARTAALQPTALTKYFNDQALLVPLEDQQRLNARLTAFEKETSSQIAVAIYPHAPADPVEDFTLRTAELSRLGRSGRDNGAVLFLFLDQKIARIEVGYGLESALTDAASHRILDDLLAPRLGRGQYPEGIEGTLDAILEKAHAEYTNDRAKPSWRVAWQYVRIAMSRVAREGWPIVRNTAIDARVGISFFGSLLGLGLWSGFANAAKLIRDSVRLIGNILRHRPLSTGLETVDLEPIWDTLKLLAILAGAITAGVMIAGGGTFGGGGAQIRW
jgi:uncharacterized membrane protein YgcG